MNLILIFHCLIFIFQIDAFLDKLYRIEVSSKEYMFLRISILNSELRSLCVLKDILYIFWFFENRSTDLISTDVTTSTIWNIIIRYSTTKVSWTTTWSSEVTLISYIKFIIKVDASSCLCSSFTYASCDVRKDTLFSDVRF